jgi:HEAT repeat protein
MRYLTLVLISAFVAAGQLAAADNELPAAAAPKAASPQEQERISAIDAVGEKGQASAAELDLLRAELKHPSPLVRAHAAHALGQLGRGAMPAVETLLPLVGDPNATVRREAARAILRIRPGPKVTIPLAKKLLGDADPALRMRILHTLAEVGKPAVPGLIAALQDDEAAKFACLALTEIGPDAADAAPALIRRLQNEKRLEVRQQIVMALGAIASPAAVPRLIDELNDPQEVTRLAAAFALGRIGPPAKAAVAALSKCSQASDPVLQVVGAWALAKVQPDDPQVMDKTVTVLADAILGKNPLARTAALRGLVDLRPGPARTLPILKQHLKNADKASAEEALHALAQLGEPAVPPLIEALKMPDCRPLAASILGYIGPPAKSAVAPLVEMAKTDKSPVARREALMALGGIGPAAAAGVPAAIAALDDADEKVVIAACFALAQLGPAAKEAIPALKKRAESKDEGVRQEAVKALKALGG